MFHSLFQAIEPWLKLNNTTESKLLKHVKQLHKITESNEPELSSACGQTVRRLQPFQQLLTREKHHFCIRYKSILRSIKTSCFFLIWKIYLNRLFLCWEVFKKCILWPKWDLPALVCLTTCPYGWLNYKHIVNTPDYWPKQALSHEDIVVNNIKRHSGETSMCSL